MRFARGTHALGECDRCGLVYPLHELRPEIYNRRVVRNRVCPDCFDPDHPQLQVGVHVVADAEAVRDPRPQRLPADINNIRWGWNPVYSLSARGELGTVTVTT